MPHFFLWSHRSAGSGRAESRRQGYDGEWRHVSSQLIALAEATPEEKFAWRPAPGVRSTSEVYMHIAIVNFYLLSVTGPKMPADLKEGMEKSVPSKAAVVNWLERSLEAVKQAHSAVTPQDLRRKVHLEDRDATVDGMYSRIIVHANEHMGQLVARMTPHPGRGTSNRNPKPSGESSGSAESWVCLLLANEVLPCFGSPTVALAASTSPLGHGTFSSVPGIYSL